MFLQEVGRVYQLPWPEAIHILLSLVIQEDVCREESVKLTIR